MASHAETPAAADAERQKALAAANSAISLDADLAEGYSARSILRSRMNWDWAGAQEDLERALTLDPGDALALARYGSLLATLGRLPEAIEVTRRAVDLDPLIAGAWDLGSQLNANGQLTEARKALTRAIEVAPKNRWTYFLLGVTALLEGNPKAALPEFERAGDSLRLAGAALAEHDLGHARESQQALDELIADARKGEAPALEQARGRDPGGWSGGSYHVAEVYAWRGERDQAFEWLDRAYARRDFRLSYLKYDPLLAKLRGDPRYTTLLRRLNLPDLGSQPVKLITYGK